MVECWVHFGLWFAATGSGEGAETKCGGGTTVKRVCVKEGLAIVSAALVMAGVAGSASAQTAARASMELLQTKTSQTQSSIDVSGQVKNISPRPVEGVTVYCDFQDAGGRVVKTAQGTLVTDPLGPAKTSDFKCSTPSNAAVKGFKIRFGQMFGGPLAMKDSRK